MSESRYSSVLSLSVSCTIVTFFFYHREIYILYGSQTGNAESLAVDLGERLTERGIANTCMPLNGAKKLPLKDLASMLIILCATTGNGDAPENADGWWRTIKLRSAVSFSIPYSEPITCVQVLLTLTSNLSM